MKHPGGTSSGARWMPLAKWLHWPSYALSQLASVIMRESSGRERADNSSAHKGLLQFAWQWYRGKWLIHGHGRVFDPWDATETLTAARDVWEDQHGSFLPAWSLTAW
jgi:hypothetical protein